MLYQLLLESSLLKRASASDDYDWKDRVGKGYLATAAGGLGTTIGSGVYGALAIPRVGRAIAPSVNKKLERYAGRYGTRILDKPPGGILEKMLGSNNPHYNPSGNYISMGKQRGNAGVLAHEVGHAAQSKAWLPARQLGGVAGMGGMLGVMLGDRDTARNSAIVGSAGLLPTVAHELDASRKGASMLGRAGVKGLGRLSPFVGVPTYAALAAAPALSYKFKDVFGGFSS